MDWNNFRSTILASNPEDWHLLVAADVGRIKSTTDDLELYVDGHGNIAHYKPDLDISLAWGAEQNNGEAWGPGHGGWGESFPDSAVYGILVDLRWRGVAVEQELVCVADGGRYYMPVMDGDEPEGGWGRGNPVTRWKVRPSAIPLPRLLHRIQMQSHDFDEALQRTGAVIVDY